MGREPYSATAKALHWGLVAAFLLLYVSLLFMGENAFLPKHRGFFYTVHKSFGLLVFGFSFWRVFLHLREKTPALPRFFARWRIASAHSVHAALYLASFLVPLTGWALSSSGGHAVYLLGILPVFDLPVGLLSEDGKTLSLVFGKAHKFAGYLALGFVFLHIFIVLRHHFVKRSKVFLGMMPRSSHAFFNRLRGISPAVRE